jgi:hypothetical protein
MEEKLVKCPHCGRTLIARLPNGLWHFAFGKSANGLFVPVELFIFGSIKIRCFRRDCGKWVIFNYFPGHTIGSDEPNIEFVQSEE